MGQTIGGIVKSVIGKNEIKDDPEAVEKTKDMLTSENEKIEMKLKQFYSDIVLESTGKGNTPTVPLCNVVDKVEQTYVFKYEKSSNVLQNTISEVVDNALEGKWTKSISTLVHGGLKAFFGPSGMSTSGETQEIRKYHVVWCNNALIRLDIFVTQTSLSHIVDSISEQHEKFGGFIMVVSVVDIAKVHNQVLIYEFSKFINQIKSEDPNAVEELKKNIEDEKDVLGVLSTLHASMSAMKASSGASIHPAVLNEIPVNDLRNDDDQNADENSERTEEGEPTREVERTSKRNKRHRKE